MIYSSPTFIFFTIASLFIFYSIPERLKVLWLILISLIWYGSWQAEWPVLLFVITNLNFIWLKFTEKSNKKDFLFLSLVCFNALIFLVLKTSGLGAGTFVSPFGSSFYIFILISLVMDKWRSSSNEESYRWSEFVLLPAFFPLLMGGPIERGKKFFSEIRGEKKLLFENIFNGIIIFSIGLIKKDFILHPLQKLSVHDHQGVLNLMLFGFMATFLTYLEFSSYTEMGRGVAKMFGIDISLSFRPFYYSKNPNDFWQRWNITLGTWLRDYLSFPLMLKYGRILGQNLILFVTFLLMGLWHGISLKHLVFGLFNGFVIVGFNLTNKKIRFPFWGRLWAFILIIGNGILGVYDKSFENIEKVHSKNSLEVLFTKDYVWLLGLLLVFVVFEWIQEKKADENWHLKIPLMLKGLISLIVVVLFFWYLDSNMLNTTPQSDVPIYFKI